MEINTVLLACECQNKAMTTTVAVFLLQFVIELLLNYYLDKCYNSFKSHWQKNTTKIFLKLLFFLNIIIIDENLISIFFKMK